MSSAPDSKYEWSRVPLHPFHPFPRSVCLSSLTFIVIRQLLFESLSSMTTFWSLSLSLFFVKYSLCLLQVPLTPLPYMCITRTFPSSLNLCHILGSPRFPSTLPCCLEKPSSSLSYPSHLSTCLAIHYHPFHRFRFSLPVSLSISLQPLFHSH